jgi:hypothetical protein
MSDAIDAKDAAETAQTGAETARDEAETAITDLGLVTENAQTGTSYTVALADVGKMVTMDNASANTVTIPAQSAVAFDNGSTLFVYQKGEGATTIEGDTGVILKDYNEPAGVSAGSLDVFGQCTIISLWREAENVWVVSGRHGGIE